jgi:hypothetical protein
MMPGAAAKTEAAREIRDMFDPESGSEKRENPA